MVRVRAVVIDRGRDNVAIYDIRQKAKILRHLSLTVALINDTRTYLLYYITIYTKYIFTY